MPQGNQKQEIAQGLEQARVQAEGIKSSLSRIKSNKSEADAFTTEAFNRLSGSVGVSSSSDSDFIQNLRNAKQRIEEGATASEAVTRSKFGRYISDQEEQNVRDITAANESRRGFATNTAVLKQIQESGEKSLNDLRQRQEELVLQGNATAAGQLADLELKEAEFMINARQQTISNLIAAAGLGLQSQGTQLQRERFEFDASRANLQDQRETERLALEFGVTVNPGESYSDIVNKVQPLASESRMLDIQSKLADIAASKAQTALAGQRLQEMQDAQDFNWEELSIIAETQPTLAPLLAQVVGDDPTKSNNFLKAQVKTLETPRRWKIDELRNHLASLTDVFSDSSQMYEYIESKENIKNKDTAKAVALEVLGLKPLIDTAQAERDREVARLREQYQGGQNLFGF